MITLQQLRVNNNLTQEQAAKKANLSSTTWINLENGRTKPQQKTLSKISKAFGVKPEEVKTGKQAETVESDETIKPDTSKVFNKLYDILADNRLPLVDYVSHLAYMPNEMKRFVSEAYKNKPDMLQIFDDCVWINKKTNAVVSDGAFKKMYLDEAVDYYQSEAWKNNKEHQSLYDFIDCYTSTFADWENVNLPDYLTDALNDHKISLSKLAGFVDKGLVDSDDINNIFYKANPDIKKKWLAGKVFVDNAKAERLLKAGYTERYIYKTNPPATYYQYENDDNHTLDMVDMQLTRAYYMKELLTNWGSYTD